MAFEESERSLELENETAADGWREKELQLAGARPWAGNLQEEKREKMKVKRCAPVLIMTA